MTTPFHKIVKFSLTVSASIIYLLYSVFHLTTFPFVHSDEIWLLKLSQHMAESRSLFVTEPFFDIFPRIPHAVKIFFHAVQIVWFSVFGYSVLSARALTLTLALLSLLPFYKIIYRRTEDHLQSFFYCALIAINIQFIYMSHFARQEAFIFLALIAVLSIAERKQFDVPTSTIAALITGMSIAIHPNSFLIATTLCSILGIAAIEQKNVKPLLTYILVSGLFAVSLVALSMAQTSDFLNQYAALGATMGTSQSLVDKLKELPIFLYKLYRGISGTYYTTDLRPTMIGAAILIALGIVSYKNCRRELAAILGLTAGIVTIGRYNATSIVFYIPIITLLLSRLLQPLSKGAQKAIIIVLIALFAQASFTEMNVQKWENFRDFNWTINQNISKNSICLANLNQAMALEKFYDYRNLDYLDERQISIAEYLKQNHIDTIIWSEEMDYIYRNIDRWHILYGKMPYYRELKEIIERQYLPVAEFESPIYGMRIASFQDGYPWKITIYERKN